MKAVAIFAPAVLAFAGVFLVMPESTRSDAQVFMSLVSSIVVWGIGAAYWVMRSPGSRWVNGGVSLLALMGILVLDLVVAIAVACGPMGKVCP